MTATPLPSENLAIAPPPPARPLQLRRAARLIRELFADPEATDKAFELFDAVGGRGDERAFQSFARTPEGRSLLVERPSLLRVLADRAALARLPADSFGRAYLAFAEQNGFAADGLLQSNERALGQINEQLDPARRFFFDRANAMHDLWHVLTGYGTDEASEVALLAFSRAQGLESRAIVLLLGAALVKAPRSNGWLFQRMVFQAWRRGRRSARLLLQRYEDLLAQPLGEVRNRLRILPHAVAHPGGVPQVELGR